MNRRWPIAGLMVLVGSVAASAASFEVVSGEGSMNQGLGFRPVAGKIAVQPGSTLHVPPGSQAFLVYENGCRVRVTPGAFVRVQKNAPCDASGRDLAAPGSSEAQNQQSNSNNDAINPYALGAVTLVGVGGLIYGISEVNKNNKTPAIFLSP
jgi:hypothetical protein